MDERLGLARVAIVATVVVWCALPFLLRDDTATDATPFVVAGELLRTHHADAVYIQPDGEVSPQFRAIACEGRGDHCDNSLPFITAPFTAPIAVAASYLSIHDAGVLFRVVDVFAFAASFALLSRRLARAETSAIPLAVAGAALTPAVVVTVATGNTTPVLVLVAALGVEACSSRALDSVVGVLVGVATVLKLFPAVLIAVALSWRRTALAIWAASTVAVFALCATLVSPLSMYPDFLTASRDWSQRLTAGGFNGALDAWGGTFGQLLGWVLRIGILAIAVRARRRVPTNARWSVALVLALAFWPQVWAYYLVFGPIAVAALVETTRRYWLLPLSALATAPAALAQHNAVDAAPLYVLSMIAVLGTIYAALPSENARAF